MKRSDKRIKGNKPEVLSKDMRPIGSIDAKFVALMDMYDGYVVLTDPSGKILFGNSRFVELLSSHSEIEHSLLTDIVHANDVVSVNSIYKKLAKDKVAELFVEDLSLSLDFAGNDVSSGFLSSQRFKMKICRTEPDSLNGLAGAYNVLVTLAPDEHKIVSFSQGDSLYQIVAENTIAGVVSCNSEGRIHYVNSAFIKMFGYAEKEIVGNSIAIILPEVYRDAHLKGLHELVKNRSENESKNIHFELPALHTSGEIFPMEMTIQLLTDDYPDQFIIFISDITQRRRAEVSLRESEELHRVTLMNAADAILLADYSGKLVHVCGNVENIFKISPMKLLKEGSIKKVLPGFVFDEEKLAAEGEIRNQLFNLSDRLNSHHSLMVSIKKVRIRGMNLLYTCSEVTEREQVLGALKSSEERFRKIFENSPVGIGISGKDHSLIQVNEALCSMLGYTKEELSGKVLADLNHGIQKIENIEIDRKLFYGVVNRFKAERKFICKNSDVLSVNYFSSMIREEDGEPVCMISLLEDITEQKNLEHRLAFTKKLTSLGELANKVAHEIGNPLSSIKHAAGVLNRFLKLDGDDKRLMEIILSESSRLSGIIDDFLKISRTSKPTFRAITFFQLYEEVEMLVKNHEKYIAKEIVITSEFEENLPMIYADGDRIKEVLWNLMLNAIDAIEESGTISIDCSLIKEKKKRFIAIDLKDTGCGINPQSLDDIFDPYFTTKFTGSGLGLSIVKKIINSHNGVINVKTQLDKGTVFTITLPVIEE